MKRCLRVPLTFYRCVPRSEILYCSSRVEGQTPTDPPHAPTSSSFSPSSPLPPPFTHPTYHPRIPHREVSTPTLYSNLVWIMCRSLAFLKWCRSLCQTSDPASDEVGGGRGGGRRDLKGRGWVGRPTAALPPRVNAKLLSFLFSCYFWESASMGRVGGGCFSLRLKKERKKTTCWLL